MLVDSPMFLLEAECLDPIVGYFRLLLFFKMKLELFPFIASGSTLGT